MNESKKIYQTPAALKQHAWKTPLSIASLALIAVVSISAINIDVHAGEPVLDTKRNTPASYTVNTFVKITDALIAGKITPKEAAQKIHATNRVNSYLTKVETEISVAVESGEMTVDEGMEKYDAAVKNINKRMGGGNSKSMTKEEYEQGVAKMVEMVNTGEITREQMEARLNRMKKAMGGEKDKSNDRVQMYLTKVGTEIREAVANGEMTTEEGKAKYLEVVEKVKQRMGGEKGKNNERAQAYLTKVGTEIRAAVASGEMTSEEGKAKYAEAEQRIQQRMGGNKSKTADTDARARYKQASDKMIEMVEAGEITRAEMEARLNRMKKAMDGDGRRGKNRDRDSGRKKPGRSK